MQSRWQRIKAKALDKKFWTTLAILIATVLILYVIELTFVSFGVKYRVVIGISMQLFSGFVLGTDQVVANLKLNNTDAIWELFAKKRMRLSFLICMLLSLVGMLIWLAISGEYDINPLTIFAGLSALAVLFYPYLFGMRFIVKFFEKGPMFPDPLVKESSIFWGNLILFLVSTGAVFLTGLFITPLDGHWVLIILWGLFGFFVTPIMFFSFGFLLVAGLIWFFNLVRRKVNRTAFWVILLGFWTWGGLLLLVGALTS